MSLYRADNALHHHHLPRHNSTDEESRVGFGWRCDSVELDSRLQRSDLMVPNTGEEESGPQPPPFSLSSWMNGM